MGCRHKAYTKFWPDSSWLVLLAGLVVVVLASQIFGVQSVSAQSELSASRPFDYYNLASPCSTYEYSNPTPVNNGSTSRFHSCIITQEGNPNHRSRICIPFDQLAFEANTGQEQATRNFYFSSSFSPIIETISDAKDLDSPDRIRDVNCQAPEGSNAVYPYYNKFTIYCQRDSPDFTGPDLGGLLVTAPRLEGICRLEARFQRAVAAFVEPAGHNQRDGWGRLVKCKKTSGGLGHVAWHCQTTFYAGGGFATTLNVCLNGVFPANYSGYDRDSYHLGVELTSLPNVDCHSFDRELYSYRLYIHCTNLERAEVANEVGGALANDKCQLQVFAAPKDTTSTPNTDNPGNIPDNPGSIDCDNAEDCPDFATVIEQCEVNDGSCGFLATANSFLSWMAYLVVPLVTIVIIVGAVQLSLAGDNPEGTKKAKTRITQAIVALVCYTLLWSVLRWLI